MLKVLFLNGAIITPFGPSILLEELAGAGLGGWSIKLEISERVLKMKP